MELGTLFILLSLLIIVALYVLSPFTRRSSRPVEDNLERLSLLTERERVLEALQELDFDAALGKVPAEEYPARRTELLEKGAGILRQLDALAPSTSSGRSAPKKKKDIAWKVETGHAALPAETSAKSAPLSDEDVEDLIAKRRSGRKDKAAGFCPKCGKPALQSDLFCPSCGEALK